MTLSVTINDIADNAENQTWTITALSPTTFSVFGSRMGDMGTAVMGVQSTHGDITLTIENGSYSTDETFTFMVHAPVGPRYVYKDDDGNIFNFEGGPDADTEGVGTWLVPRRMFENLPKTLDDEINYGDMLDHFRTILKAQSDFEGSSFGINNSRNLTIDPGFAGIIREHNGNLPLLISMLIQRDISPLSIIDFGEYQYRLALSSIDQFLVNELATFLSSNSLTLSSISSSNSGIQDLLERFEEVRALDENLRQVYTDTTAPVVYWPISLAMMGLVPAVEPTIEFDHILGIDVIVHHDGHRSAVVSTDADFDRELVSTIVTRSDDEETAGSFSESAPSNPYAKQLWFKLSTQQVYIFDVRYDSDTTPSSADDGDFWYRRTANELREYDATLQTWIVSSDPVASRWIAVDTSVIRNSLVLAVEEKLFTGVHSEIAIKMDVDLYEDSKESELAKFAARSNFDTYAPDYDETDAFTWNYSAATISGVTAGLARWHQIYLDYFEQAVGIATCRPNLEPWVLLGYATKAAASTGLSIDWDDEYADVTSTRLWNDDMWDFIQSEVPGLKICVDPTTDILLPPYVPALTGNASYALTNVVPPTPEASYEFGDWGPVETVWRKSLEYFYSCARVTFENDPMNFLDNVWGYTYFTASSGAIRLERSLMRPLSSNDFKMHGETLDLIVDRSDTSSHFSNTGGITTTTAATVRFLVAHVEDNETIFDVYVNDELQGFVREGITFSFGPVDGVTFTNVKINDLGKGFNLGDEFTLEITP